MVDSRGVTRRVGATADPPPDLSGRARIIAAWVLHHAAEIDGVPNGSLRFDWGDEGGLKPRIERFYPRVRPAR